MSEFLNKISLYDQLGFIVVGGIFYAFLGYDLAYFSLDLKKLTDSALEIGVAVYFLGHVAQAIANVLIRENKEGFSIPQQEVLGRVKQYFTSPQATDGQAFSLCYLWATGVDKTGHISEMNAKYGLYRGWATVLFLQSLFYLIVLICSIAQTSIQEAWQTDKALFIGLMFCAPVAFLMLRRSWRFYKLIGDKTLQTFVINNLQMPAVTRANP